MFPSSLYKRTDRIFLVLASKAKCIILIAACKKNGEPGGGGTVKMRVPACKFQGCALKGEENL